jgi:hypothetical protein
MENGKKGKSKRYNKPDIKKKNGLTIVYDKEEFNERFPHLINEINGKKNTVKIESVERVLNGGNFVSDNLHPRELVNPGAIDFIRRCTTLKEAFSILDFLLKRQELSKSDYENIKIQIQQEQNLKSFIDKHGGFKSPGYYEKKYRTLTREKEIQNQEE